MSVKVEVIQLLVFLFIDDVNRDIYFFIDLVIELGFQIVSLVDFLLYNENKYML